MNNNEVMNDLLFSNEAIFEQLYKKYFRELRAYAYSLLGDWDVA